MEDAPTAVPSTLPQSDNANDDVLGSEGAHKLPSALGLRSAGATAFASGSEVDDMIRAVRRVEWSVRLSIVRADSSGVG